MLRALHLPTFRNLLIASLIIQFGVSNSLAQIEAPDRKILFKEDAREVERAREVSRVAAVKSDRAESQDLDFKAPTVEFDQERKVMSGKGGVILSQRGLRAQADSGEMNTESNLANFHGNVLFTTDDLNLAATHGSFNTESETGEFDDAEFTYEDGGYLVRAEKLFKLSETKYRLLGSDLTTCHCGEGSQPWSFGSSETNITQEGYAYSKNVTFNIHGVPVFYSPYFAFPVKTERTSGLLNPTFGYSSDNGVEFSIPLFIALSEQSDLTLTPFTESKTRNGVSVDYRHAFSKRNNVTSRITYSDESPRDDDLRGTNVDGLDDPEFDTDRFGGFYSQLWRTDRGALVPSTLIADFHYVGDDLFPREISDADIAADDARYTTSILSLQSSFGEYVSASLTGEFNQDLIEDDDLIFQRLPELSVVGLRSFRPFGQNALGAKLVTRADLAVTQFARDEGYDGTRIDIKPGIRVPFHYKNYLNSEIFAAVRQTEYRLDETLNPDDNSELDSSGSRTVPELGGQVSTAVERVFDVEKDGWFANMVGEGRLNQGSQLVRLKHTIEPSIRYTYIPGTEQGDLPLFDSVDRIREKSLFAFGVRTALVGRFDSTDPAREEITELAPTIEDLPVFDFDRALTELDSSSPFSERFGGDFRPRRGQIRDLVALTIKQSYDYNEDEKDLDPNLNPWSDLGGALEFYPNNSFGLTLESNFDTYDKKFSSWGASAQVFDDREDSIRARYTYIDENLSQLDGNVELRVTDRVRIGYYGVFDDEKSEILENAVGLRLKSSCNCWTIDIGYHERINPDTNKFLVTFTLGEIGAIG